MPRLIATLVPLIALIGCTSPSPVSERIGEQARTTGEVDLSKITDFEWTTVHIYSPYTSGKIICTDLGALWSTCGESVPPFVSEGDFFLVFSDSKGVFRPITHSRRNGNFCSSSCALTISRSRAVFKAVPTVTSAHGSQLYALVQKSP